MAVVGGIIGGGIFRTPAAVAERLRSPGLTLIAWVLGGVVALIGAFCFGELGQRRPKAGGGYVSLREAWGPLPAFLYGWALLLVIATGAIAAVAVTFADYTLALLGLPARLAVPVAVFAIVLLAGINYFGVRPGAITVNILTVLQLAALARRLGRVPSLWGCAGAGPVYVRGLAADQLHRRGDRRARAHPAARAGAWRGRGSGGVPAGQPGVPAGARAGRSGGEQRARGRHHATTPRTGRRHLHRGGDRDLDVRVPRPGHP